MSDPRTHAQRSRVELYRVGETGLRLTLSRSSDGTFDLARNSGVPIYESFSFDKAIDRTVT